ncbi:MAG: nucleotidyl transferase AbiEii/AbiGii toxin family protein [Waddliaceae bacterium]
MKLFEHPDFDQAIIRSTDYFKSLGFREAFIEKDYYVTETLRMIQKEAGDKVIFKGGTSLSKGWNLIHRFSEDVDIFFDPYTFTPPLGKNAINCELKKLKEKLGAHPALKFLEKESRTIGGFGRADYFEYKQKFGGRGDIINKILVETGTASGKEPTANIKIQSYLGKYLRENGLSLNAEDEDSFKMNLLHFRRTFVEKLFAIHAKVELSKKSGIGIGGYARHYYDLFCLSDRDEVWEMLRSDEYEKIKSDYNNVCMIHFKKNYIPPEAMSFSNSDAIFPNEDLDMKLGKEYEKQCHLLCFGDYPSWVQVKDRFQQMKDLL